MIAVSSERRVEHCICAFRFGRVCFKVMDGLKRSISRMSDLFICGYHRLLPSSKISSFSDLLTVAGIPLTMMNACILIMRALWL